MTVYIQGANDMIYIYILNRDIIIDSVKKIAPRRTWSLAG